MLNTPFKLSIYTLTLGSFLFLGACGDQGQTFSLLPDSDNFVQQTSKTNTKIDILWVIDNSGSMETSQNQLASNFNSFIQDFSDKGFDFRIAVTTTEAYYAIDDFYDANYYAEYRDGTDDTSHTGVHVINPSTPNLEDTFVTNIMQGIDGSGNERAFQSLRTALDPDINDGVNDSHDFPRNDAFLAVVIVSDEDDFSHDGLSFIEDYSYSGLHEPQEYVNHLDNLTGSSDDNRRYSVSAMAIFDNQCYEDLTDSFSGRKIATRYEELVNLTGGVTGSLCDNFASTLTSIADNILTLATQFYLSRVPEPSTLTIAVDGTPIPACYVDASTGDPTPLEGPNTEANPEGCGFTYHEDSNSVKFYGAYIPPQGSNIDVDYDPVAYGK